MNRQLESRTEGRIVRIGGASGFWGDSSLGPLQLVRAGGIDYLVFDYLAELTMSILAGARMKKPEEGYATDFVTVALRSVLRQAAEKGIRIVSNAGGVNPKGCAAAVQALADELGVTVRIAVVEGDDVLPLAAAMRDAGTVEMSSGEAMPQRLVTANAYLGALPIARALDAGANIVVTGRCVDSAVTLGVLMHEFGWEADDFDRLAAGSLAGHIIECGCQATGGLHTDWASVPDWADIGYPIVECREDGSFVVTKPPQTGGLVTPATIGEQLLYEIGDPANYLLPDVVCDFRQVRIENAGPDRVLVTGARGRSPTGTYKVSATLPAGFKVSAQLTIVGIDAPAKARRTGEALLERGRRLLHEGGFADFLATNIELLGTESAYGPHARLLPTREVVLRLTVTHSDRSALQMYSREFAAPGTSWSPGTTGAGGRPPVSPVLRQFAWLIAKEQVTPTVTLGDTTFPVTLPPPQPQRAPEPLATSQGILPAGPGKSVPLVRIAFGRSGDKGDTSNIGLIARHPALLPVLQEQVTPERVKAYLGHLVQGPVRRYELPGIHAINLVCERALGGGGMASLRNDPLGKGMAQMLLDMPVEVPESLLQDLPS
ncbi:acyclic terpene utilization AtuA family protein [Variovorax sp. J22R133]|uniref:acyclic terpene utilization AtuA family protein n=1 Tax=Variovorax brevis TaxID=3053503 RepID=UPI002576BD41|nr:acyclic terpene utilization AtuA family protein [Variovorax sp. J22R133]MDM0116650.1 acyclic terpene utilization AtuA family protein [Variovorax sp. J22R133]